MNNKKLPIVLTSIDERLPLKPKKLDVLNAHKKKA
jgi:hypothetical protein